MSGSEIRHFDNPPICVFISYAWENEEYSDWLAQLAVQFREYGVNARLDRWHLKDGQTIPEFMNSEVRQTDKVLVLCSFVLFIWYATH